MKETNKMCTIDVYLLLLSCGHGYIYVEFYDAFYIDGNSCLYTEADTFAWKIKSLKST